MEMHDLHGRSRLRGRVRMASAAFARVVCMAGILAMAITRSAHAGPAAPPPLEGVGVDERVGARIPLELSFVAASGAADTAAAVRLGDYFDGEKPVLLVLAYARCPMLCSLVLRGVADVVAGMAREHESEPGRDYRVVALSIDPADRPHEASRVQAVLLERAGKPGRPDAWPFLTGTEPEIRALAGSLGFRYTWDARTEQFAHPAVLFVLAPDGRIARYFHGVRFAPAEVAAALRDAGDGRMAASASGGGAISCFRFDAVLRKYGAYIQSFFRGGALVIAAALLVAVFVLVRRERGRGRRGGSMQE